MMNSKVTIGIIAPSSVVPREEMKRGVEFLRRRQLSVLVHSQCYRRHLFFAGTDLERAKSLLEYAYDPQIDILWCARGGYGSTRILPALEKFSKKKGIPKKKLLVGFSDSTALQEFVRSHWGWSILHAPMPGVKEFVSLSEFNFKKILNYIEKTKVPSLLRHKKLKFLTTPPVKAIQAEMIGGNLSVLASLAGTPYAAHGSGKIFFLEDVGESFYRLDRMMTQLILSGGMQGVKALVLGRFHGCSDQALRNLRPSLSFSKGLEAVFGAWGRTLKISVAMGLSVGHGVAQTPLPLGAEYRLTPQGQLNLMSWDWLIS